MIFAFPKMGALMGSRWVRHADRFPGRMERMVRTVDPTPMDDDQLHSLKKRLTRSYTKQSAFYDARRSMSVSARFFFEVAYQTLDERVGPGNFWDGSYFLYSIIDFEDCHVGNPSVTAKQGIIVMADPLGWSLAGDCMIKHSAQTLSIYSAFLYGKTYDPTRVLIHDQQNPITLQQNRFTAEQIH